MFQLLSLPRAENPFTAGWGASVGQRRIHSVSSHYCPNFANNVSKELKSVSLDSKENDEHNGISFCEDILNICDAGRIFLWKGTISILSLLRHCV